MKFLILGAGPAGLAMGMELKNRGEDSFLILEKEAEAGGLCRSETVDGAQQDLGGGHFLDARPSRGQSFLFRYMPKEEWNFFERDSKIMVKGHLIGSPIEAHIWQLPTAEQVEYLKSIARAGANLDTPMPENFVDWIYWKLGERIAEDYMIPYNTKMFGKYLNDLGTYWLYKLPTVSFEDTLLSCLERRMYGSQPAHTCFYYPKRYGFGEVFRRMAQELSDKIEYGVDLKELDCENRSVNGQYQADIVINTIPWTEWTGLRNAPDEIHKAVGELKYTSLQVRYFGWTNQDQKTHWTYFPDLAIEYHREFYRSNFLLGSKGGYYETNTDRICSEHTDDWRYVNKYAYPCNTVKKPQAIKEILSFMESKRIFGIGRWGEWEHLNADRVVEHALDLAGRLL